MTSEVYQKRKLHAYNFWRNVLCLRVRICSKNLEATVRVQKLFIIKCTLLSSKLRDIIAEQILVLTLLLYIFPLFQVIAFCIKILYVLPLFVIIKKNSKCEKPSIR